jgi:hypothetical protein
VNSVELLDQVRTRNSFPFRLHLAWILVLLQHHHCEQHNPIFLFVSESFRSDSCITKIGVRWSRVTFPDGPWSVVIGSEGQGHWTIEEQPRAALPICSCPGSDLLDDLTTARL